MSAHEEAEAEAETDESVNSFEILGKVRPTDHPQFDEEEQIFTEPNGCPECGSDLEYFFGSNDGFQTDADIKAFADRCVNYGDGCTHRTP